MQATLNYRPKRLSAWRARCAQAMMLILLANAALRAQATGIPTVDAANLAQNALNHIEDIAKYTEQIAVLKDQLENAQRRYAAITGTRNLGEILNDPSIRSTLPSDVQSILRRGSNSLGSLESSTQRIMNEERLSGNYMVDRRALDQRAEDLAVRTKALLESAQSGTTARLQQLDNLQSQINLTTDPKAISDLQARLLVEQANIQADQMRADALSRQLQAEKALMEQQAQKLAAQSFSIDAIRAPLPGAQ
ncbi:hypothetical protein CAL26_01440 [Bordetella genomosp. 9]|uniref:Type VI secretion protein n=1 Tax=Bordetella genomosp. 9 TaxID=1416803 RepID=A0A261RM75_9BORD|nr:type IV secretion system protein [Bordetella genomosp. 9]OZI26045.1 hypothetical protein CAL26_01440 [Bordetella genomosp. 9]